MHGKSQDTTSNSSPTEHAMAALRKAVEEAQKEDVTSVHLKQSLNTVLASAVFPMREQMLFQLQTPLR